MILRVCAWIILLYKLLISGSNFVQITEALFFIELALNIPSFQKIFIQLGKEGVTGIQLERVKNEIYTQVIEDFTEVIGYLLTKTGKLAGRKRGEELILFKNKLIEILKSSDASETTLKRVSNVMFEEINSDFQFNITSRTRQILMNPYASSKIIMNEITDCVKEYLQKGQADKVIPFLKENITSSTLETDLSEIEIMLKEYKSFLKETE